VVHDRREIKRNFTRGVGERRMKKRNYTRRCNVEKGVVMRLGDE